MRSTYAKRTDATGSQVLESTLPGPLLLKHPLLNKGTAFSGEEREALGLWGLLPSKVETLDEQVERAYAGLRACGSPISQYCFLRGLQDRQEVLFYALLARHIEELLPIIYTPTVGEAVESFSSLYAGPRGLVVTEESLPRLDAALEVLPQPEVELVVVTDAESILGIGDQGVGGLAISIGKLSLYTAAAGIDPARTLPVVLDVGTSRKALLEDPRYLGVRKPRLAGEAYQRVVDGFVDSLRRRFPHALLQWEDFSKQRAFDQLERHRDSLPSFNDDIQGTGAVVLAGLLAARRRTKRKLSEEVVLVHGAGAGGVGVARQVAAGMQEEGLTAEQARARIYLLDSKGLILEDRAELEPYKRPFAKPMSAVAGWKVAGPVPSLLETVRGGKVTVLLGLSGQKGAFDEPVVRQVAEHAKVPLVLALSNPTSNTEALPEDVLRWTGGRALVATGSPFPDVRLPSGDVRAVGQGNNAFIFPGLGLATLLSGARRVSDGMLLAASQALADFTSAERLAKGALYPRITDLREASLRVAVAVLKAAQRDGLARAEIPEQPEAWLKARMWRPEYLPVRRPERRS